MSASERARQPRGGRYDLAVLGGGAAGLSIAAGAARFGLSVILFEPGEMGGDCLNRGCVPSKAFIAAAGRIAARRTAGAAIPAQAGFSEAMANAKRAVAAIAPHDSQERFEGLGVEVVRAAARFVGPDEVEADGRRVRARRFALATGSEPLIPPIPGLAETPCLTTDALWSLAAAPERIAVIGGGAVGVELAQAFARLGVKATLVETAARLLPRAPVAVSRAARVALEGAGVDVRLGETIARVAHEGGTFALRLGGGVDPLEADGLLVAAGRAPRVRDLGLDAAGIALEQGRVVADARLRTANPRVYVLGDAAGREALTHAAGFHASVALRNVVFRLPARADRTPMPQAVYADPELAWIGVAEEDAPIGARIARWAFADNDRAQAEGRLDGEAVLIAGKGGRILGGHVVGPGAGELISTIALAMQSRLKLSALASMIAPYPTRAEILKRAAGAWYEPVVFGRPARALAGLLARLG